MGFLKKITGQKSKLQRNRTCRSKEAVKMLKEPGTQTLGEHIDKRQAKVAEWVSLIPIMDICNRETGYEVGGRCIETWWRQTAAQKQLSATLEEILVAARAECW